MKQKLEFLKNHITLILAIVSGYLYLCTYFFELSYLQVFDIPSDYISIDLNTILSDSVRIIQLVAIAVIVYKGVELPFKKWMSKSDFNNYIGSVICSSATLLSLARIAFFIPNSILLKAFYVWIVIVIITSFFVLKSIIYHRKKAFSQPDNAQRIEIPINTITLFLTNYKIILIILFPLVICGWIGEGTATKLTKLSMINDSTKYY